MREFTVCLTAGAPVTFDVSARAPLDVTFWHDGEEHHPRVGGELSESAWVLAPRTSGRYILRLSTNARTHATVGFAIRTRPGVHSDDAEQ